ncbi:MAG: arginine deiminase [Myxococcota bacterium]
MAVGDSYRTNPAGIAQLRALLPDVNVEVFQLPHARGPVECLHLQSLVAFVDADLAVVHRSMAPVALLRALAQRGVDTLELAPDELDTQGANILCTAPRRVVMAAGNPRTASALRENSVHVTEIDGDQLMVIGAGGPTCLTLALDRG